MNNITVRYADTWGDIYHHWEENKNVKKIFFFSRPSLDTKFGFRYGSSTLPMRLWEANVLLYKLFQGVLAEGGDGGGRDVMVECLNF